MDIDPRLRSLEDNSNSPSFDQRAKNNSYPNPLQPSKAPLHSAESPNTSHGSAPGSSTFYPGLPATPQSFYPSANTSVNSAAPHYDDTDQPNGDPSSTRFSHEDNNSISRSRACEACRSLKVRCEPDPAHPEGTCKRCAKAGRQCIVTVPNRKRLKKTDSRVAELERKIDALTASLHASQTHKTGERPEPVFDMASTSSYTHPDQPSSASAGWMGHTPGSQDGILAQSMRGVPTPPVVPGSKRKRSDDTGDYVNPPSNSYLVSSPPSIPPRLPCGLSASTPRPTTKDFVDIIDRQVIDLDTAQLMFQRFVKEMAPIMPVVVFPPGTQVFDVRRKRPILFLAIMSVASGTIRPELQTMLIDEVHRLFADRVMVKGEKSLELIQSLLVATLWYQPPEQYEELKFYQFIHIAATIGIDIGMGKRSKPTEKKFMGIWKDSAWKKSHVPDPDALETRRAWLGCYFLCANAAMSLRRPVLLRWQPYMDECIELLENSPDAYATDKVLCQWIKLQHIAEEVTIQFSMDDPTGAVAVSEPKVQYALKGFKSQLDDWRKDVTKDQYTPVLKLGDHVVNLFVHEVAMHSDQNGDEFRPPYEPHSVDSAAELEISPAHIGALTTCLTSIHNIFETLLGLDIKVVRNLPTIHLVRMTYSSVALIKLYSSVTAPGTKLEKVFNLEDLKVEYYLNRILAFLGKAAEDDLSKPAAKFLQILSMLMTWYQKRKDSKGNKDGVNTSRLPSVVPPVSTSDGNGGPWSVQAPSDGERGKETSRNTPLHLLSAVAMGEPGTSGPLSTSAGDGGQQTYGQVPASNNGLTGYTLEQMGFGGDLDQALGFGFAADDISAIFLDDPFLNIAPTDMPMSGYMENQTL